MKKKDKKKTEKEERHLGTKILRDIADAIEFGLPSERRRKLLNDAFREGVSMEKITVTTIEGIRRPFKER